MGFGFRRPPKAPLTMQVVMDISAVHMAGVPYDQFEQGLQVALESPGAKSDTAGTRY